MQLYRGILYFLITGVLMACGGGGGNPVTGPVPDTTAPVITLTGANPQIIEMNNAYTELGATAHDNLDGDITADISADASAVDTTTLGSYSVSYDVSDAAGNAAVTLTRTINVVDTTAPVINLIGANPQTIEINSAYTELGATVQDNVDGNITADISADASAVDTTTLGSYSVSYDVSDAAGNAAVTLTRTVNVVDTTGGGTDTFTVGGTLTGLAGGASVTLQNNAGDDLNLTADGSFTFATALTNGSAYSVTVLTQPTSPSQTCGVTNGAGNMAGANVINVSVTCPVILATWVGGSDLANQLGIYGTKGVADPGNMPGSRIYALTWIDRFGVFWLFGGHGYDSIGTKGLLNDLWKFDGTNWTWISGGNVASASGVYGTKGIAAASNIPGSRAESVSWIDGFDNLWLFGGDGLDSSGTRGFLNDLWKFDGTNWTWISGSDVVNVGGVYGTKGIAAASNVPGSRSRAMSSTDSLGNFWLYGGRDNLSVTGFKNDLWKFDGTNWTWVHGKQSNALWDDNLGVYGTKGVAAPTNIPGARLRSAFWIDGSNNIWVFGGLGFDTSAVGGNGLNDLWKFDGTNWTWISGESFLGSSGTFGTIGVTTANDVPSARGSPASWIDSNNTFWLFGGDGSNAFGNTARLNDLWKFDGANWTWMSGDKNGNNPGNYGTKGVSSASNAIGSRRAASTWIDSNDKLWLFGGVGSGSVGNSGYLNDLWYYEP